MTAARWCQAKLVRGYGARRRDQPLARPRRLHYKGGVSDIVESRHDLDRTVRSARPRRAYVAAIKLKGFRNYASLALALDERSVVLTGPNGAGKTNLLEAVSFLSPGRGLRRAALDEVARHGGDGAWAVAARIVNAAGAVEIGTGVTLGADGPESVRARPRQSRRRRVRPKRCSSISASSG